MNAAAGDGASTPSTPEPGTPGELLRKQRERRALSVQQAAEDLHLDAATIEAIEADRFQAFGAPVYAKGHLRKYAILVGLSPELVIQRYEALSDTPTVPTPIPATVAGQPIRERRSMKVPLAIAMGIVLIALAWRVFVWLTTPAPQVEVEPPISPTESAPVAQIAPPVTIAPTAEEAAKPAATIASAMEAGPKPAEAAPISPAPAARVEATPSIRAAGGEIQVTLEFSEPSWTEIYDAAGSRLMFDTGAPGRVRSVRGTPPLRVTLGFASAVNVRVDGRQIVVPRRAGRDAAKFTIEADGSAR